MTRNYWEVHEEEYEIMRDWFGFENDMEQNPWEDHEPTEIEIEMMARCL